MLGNARTYEQPDFGEAEPFKGMPFGDGDLSLDRADKSVEIGLRIVFGPAAVHSWVRACDPFFFRAGFARFWVWIERSNLHSDGATVVQRNENVYPSLRAAGVGMDGTRQTKRNRCKRCSTRPFSCS